MPESIITPSFFLAILGLFTVGAFGALLFFRNDMVARLWTVIFSVVGSIVGLVFSGGLIASGGSISFTLPSSLPFLSLIVRIDLLSAFFIFLISLIALCSSVYAFGYTRHFEKKYSLASLGFFYNLFIASMLLVVTAQHALFFLLAWEVMSLASYFLVVYERHEPENIKAGSLYFIMTHIGTAFIIFSFLLLYKATGSFDFQVISQTIGGASVLIKNLIFISALIGFGVKAGIIPLHIWLPSAHPAAPSHVSALMSGVMIKTGIYMLIRVCFGMLGMPMMWWGVLILVLGAISSLLGVLYALAEHDIKKLLAYHSIENIGIILLGVGSAVIFTSANMIGLALLALIAALFHTMNHAIFKALLFLGAGSIISKTHTRNIEEYGGLIKLMPITGFFFLIGSMAISALPPLNGFASEWLTFQALFSGLIGFGLGVKSVFILAIASLAFTGGLAAACFVKAFGAAFLARPRSEEAIHASESSASLLFGMGCLAILTFVFGIGSTTVVEILSPIVGTLFGVSTDISMPIVLSAGFSSISLFIFFVILVVALFFTALFVAIVSRKQTERIGRTWDCGTDLASRMEITATGFSRSIIVIFQQLLRPVKTIESEYYDGARGYFLKKSTVTLSLTDVYRSAMVDRVLVLATRMSNVVKGIQSGNTNAYVLYIFIALLVVLATLLF